MEKEKRIVGIDIIRILSMFGIIGLHVINNGGVLAALDIHTIKYYVVLLLLIILYSSVNIFGILSGYLCVNRGKNRNSRIIELLVILLFYTIVIPSVFYGFNFCNIRSLGIKEALLNFFPILIGRYWYITCYVFLFFMMPYLNLFCKKIDKKTFKKMILLLFVLLSIVPNFIGMVDLFHIENGYSPFWLIFMYLIGAYMKLYPEDISNKKSIIISISCIISSIFINSLIRNVGLMILGRVVRGEWFINYISPFTVIFAISIVSLFKKIKCSNNNAKKIVKYFAEAAFSVYIIHSHKVIYDYLIKDAFSFMNNYNGIIIVILVLLSIVVIYLLCCIIDFIRKGIFKLLLINSLIEKMGAKLDKILE